MDPLVAILAESRLTGALYCLTMGHGVWGLRVPAMDRAFLLCMRSGRCFVRVNEKVIPLDAGEIVILVSGVAHDVLSDPTSPAIPLEAALMTMNLDRDRVLTVGTGDLRSELVCGGFEFEARAWNPILSLLPDIMHLSAESASRPTLEAVLEASTRELRSRRMGSEVVLARLAEVVLIEAVRAYIADLADEQATPGWLRGLADAAVSQALAAMHAQPEHPWTVLELAGLGHLSRSAFGSRFRSLVGVAPSVYLTRWRMLRAASYLTATDLAISDVALRVGYRSEYSFGRAFKASTGSSPGRYRAEFRRVDGDDAGQPHTRTLEHADAGDEASSMGVV